MGRSLFRLAVRQSGKLVLGVHWYLLSAVPGVVYRNWRIVVDYNNNNALLRPNAYGTLFSYNYLHPST